MAEYAATGLPPAYIPLERERHAALEQASSDDAHDNASNDTEGI